MIHHCLPVGPLAANCFILACAHTKEALVVDPGGDGPKILKFLDSQGLKLKTIVDTHGHFDHIDANDDLRKATGAKLLIHALDNEMLRDPMKNLTAFFMGGKKTYQPADGYLKDGDTIKVGTLQLEVIHTPGHTPGGISLKGADSIWAGDTLFQGSIGRSDFPGGDGQLLLKSIKEKLLTLPDATIVYSGHGSSTTIGEEKRGNPFIR